jgi:endonuclease/exonuclease/phosphatase family metal-dependent hydrolase
MLAVKLLSLNIWDLPIPLPGVNHRRRRLEILKRVPPLGADVVLIQEAFRPAFKLALRRALPDYYGDHYLAGSRRRWGVKWDTSGGLLTLSRWPVLRSRYLPAYTVPGMRWDERLGSKGCLLTLLSTPAGHLWVGNVHLHAGTGENARRARVLQVRHLLQALPPPGRERLVLGGDFNMDPATERLEEPTGWDLLLAAGFREVAGGLGGSLATVVQRRNRYARYWPGRHPDRRLTHFFYWGKGIRPMPGSACVCLDDPPVSDHFGLMAHIELTPAGAAARSAGAQCQVLGLGVEAG